MLYYILDLEYNQYFNFQSQNSRPPELACPSEIIQMGVVVMDGKMNVKDKAGTLVRPQIFRRLHPYVQRITGLTMDELREAPSFPEAFETFFNFAFGKRAAFCTWGGDDIKDLYRNILYYDLNHKTLPRRYLNVQRLYGSYRNKEGALEREGLPVTGTDAVNEDTEASPNPAKSQQIGLKTAAQEIGLPLVRPFHNALSDAEYTADILQYLMNDKSAADGVQFQTLNIGELKQNINGRVNAVNINLLYTHAERAMRRKLNERDKAAVLDIYNLGRAGKFDVHRRRDK